LAEGPLEAGRVPAVEDHPLDAWRQLAQPGEVVGLRVADRAVQAALAPAGRVHGPDRDAALAHELVAPLEGQLGERLAEQLAEDAPEQVARVRVVVAGRQRGLAGEAAEDQQPRPRARDRREADPGRRRHGAQRGAAAGPLAALAAL